MKLYLQITVVIMAAFSHMVPVFGLVCPSLCAACFDGSGAQSKFKCNGVGGECGSCPDGYTNMFCTNWSDCE